MNTERLQRILQKLKEKNLSQMIISDPLAIYYLTGRLIDPGERLLALYISQSGNNRIFINNLFTVPEDLGVEKVRFSDTDDSIALLAEALTPGEALGIDKIFPARFLLPLMERASASSYVLSSVCVDEVRACKDEEEKEKMRASSRVNDAAMARFREMVHEGVTEKDVAAHMLEIYQELGAEAYSFPPLVGFGPNAANGHHEPDDTVLKAGDCIVIDMGCKKARYCSDMTRTYFCKEAPAEYAAIHDLVRSANELAESMIRPGVPLCDLDKAARDHIAAAGYGEYFTHRLGHFIGQNDHEKGDVSSANHNLAKPGMIFSIEPGVYLPGKFGVRVEDLVLVTEDGCEVLNHVDKHWKTVG